MIIYFIFCTLIFSIIALSILCVMLYIRNTYQSIKKFLQSIRKTDNEKVEVRPIPYDKFRHESIKLDHKGKFIELLNQPLSERNFRIDRDEEEFNLYIKCGALIDKLEDRYDIYIYYKDDIEFLASLPLTAIADYKYENLTSSRILCYSDGTGSTGSYWDWFQYELRIEYKMP